MAKKIYVFDTSVCLTDVNSLKSFGTDDIVIPLKVLDEIDSHKKRQDTVGLNARLTIRLLDILREKGNLTKGTRIGKGMGLLSVRVPNHHGLIDSLEPSSPDNQIIGTALTVKAENPRKKVTVVSRDINMRVKCESVGLLAKDYAVGQVVKDTSTLYNGTSNHLVDDQLIDQFYAGEKIYLDEEEGKFYPGQLIMLVSNSNEKKTALCKFLNYNKPICKLLTYDNVWGVKPRNKEQLYALNLLMDPTIPVVSLIGKAGSGKTLLALASGLEQTLEGANLSSLYKKVIVSRSIQPLGKDIGFLPGTLEEKMTPWLMPIQDNLEYLMGGDKCTLMDYMEKGLIEIEALTYIRGRSISNAYIIIDEAQNLTSHELKTILTRVGEGTKIILTGDIEQIDNAYVDETTNGLTYAVEKLKHHELSGHITLVKGERSKVASLAARIL